MEIADCPFNFEYDGNYFDFKLSKSPHLVKGMYWVPNNQKPTKIVIYVHGLNSMLVSERDSVPVYLERGFAYFSSDHIGHGKSEGSPLCCNVDEIIEETLYVVSYAHKMFPELPIYLKGHSLGGLVVLSCGLFHTEDLVRNNIKGIIAIAPYISSCPKIPIALYESILIYLTSIFAPLMKLPTGENSFPDDIPRQYSDWILSHARAKNFITPRLLASCLRQITKVLPMAEKWPESIPLLFTQGMKDDMVDPVVNLDWANRVLSAHPDTIEIHTYQMATHQITRCPYRGEQFRHIFNWISTLGTK